MSNPATAVDVIALGQPTFGEPEIRAIEEVFRSGWVAGQGPTGTALRGGVRPVGRHRSTRCRSTTARPPCTWPSPPSVLSPGDEVVVADYTFPATGHSVVYGGGKPVFADVLPDTWTVDPQAVEAAITERTVGIMAVDTLGPAGRLRRARGHRGQARPVAGRGRRLLRPARPTEGRPAGSFGDAACFSFHGRKGITAGEGGALTTDREDIADARPQDRTTSASRAPSTAPGTTGLPVPEFDEIGYNYKLSDVAAAIMLAQLDRLADLVKARQGVADAYQQLLGDFDLVTPAR